jgi:hypothetical protein
VIARTQGDHIYPFKDTKTTKYRGRLYIHTSQYSSAQYQKTAWYWMEEHIKANLRCDPIFGHIIGYVELVDCVQNSPSKWAMPDHYHRLFNYPVVLPNTIPCKGKLGIWNFEID